MPYQSKFFTPMSEQTNDVSFRSFLIGMTTFSAILLLSFGLAYLSNKNKRLADETAELLSIDSDSECSDSDEFDPEVFISELGMTMNY